MMMSSEESPATSNKRQCYLCPHLRKTFNQDSCAAKEGWRKGMWLAECEVQRCNWNRAVQYYAATFEVAEIIQGNDGENMSAADCYVDTSLALLKALQRCSFQTHPQALLLRVTRQLQRSYSFLTVVALIEPLRRAVSDEITVDQIDDEYCYVVPTFAHSISLRSFSLRSFK